jgi:hypothetical protein
MDIANWLESFVGGYELHWENLGTWSGNFYELGLMAFPVGLPYMAPGEPIKIINHN